MTGVNGLDKFNKFMEGFTPGFGAISSALGGIGSLLGRKSSEKWMKRNFELQKEMMEKNLHMQYEAQRLAQDQFNRTMDFNTPATQRRMMEEAGINPFMQGSAVSAGGANVGQVLNPTPLEAPQYDLNSVYQDEVTRQSRVSSAIGNINGILDGALKLGTFASKLKSSTSKAVKDEVDASVSKATQVFQELMAEYDFENKKQDLINKRTENALKELDLSWAPKEKQAEYAKTLAEADLLTKQGVYYDEKKNEVVANTEVLKQQREKIVAEIGLLHEQRTGLKLTNAQQAIILKYAERRQQAELDNIKASTGNLQANTAYTNQKTKTEENQTLRSGVPTNPTELAFWIADGRPVPDDAKEYIRRMDSKQKAELYNAWVDLTRNGIGIGHDLNTLVGGALDNVDKGLNLFSPVKRVIGFK